MSTEREGAPSLPHLPHVSLPWPWVAGMRRPGGNDLDAWDRPSPRGVSVDVDVKRSTGQLRLSSGVRRHEVQDMRHGAVHLSPTAQARAL